MCIGCWQEYGSPRLSTPDVKSAAEKVDAVYEESAVGGNLHIVIDDWNIEDDALDWCRENTEMTTAEIACYEALRPISYARRASALAMHAGFF